ncbi:MAG TPA: MBL fold metallo-hydrolase [Clostridiaceae bacterium]|jgi:metallo-beta-lactamase family protein|nr:MBL fold metallo-hydrolase [Clostridium sp.]MEE0128017.1 MBL fold metallo-hydrolase [Clostridia bacterium]HJJ12257.1 MBL fold metallo-hydrolase [Clostridiaceae bacterium]
MKITFLGATKTVTGSNFLVEGAGKKFLVDCGLYQGKATEELENEEPFEFDINSIDFMLLTHAHIDHSGRIPKLYKEGYRKDIIATKATCDLCSIMLPDSGHIQEMEMSWTNRKRIRKGETELEPLYTAEEAARSLELFKPVSYDEIIEIDENIHVRFNDAGHMLGSSTIEVWVRENDKEEKIVFSGDLGNNDIPLLSEPTMIEDTDYLVMESTYGSRLHMRNDDKAELFLNIVSETLEQGGTVVIPSFAVGRTQEILFEINKLKDKKDDEEFRKKYEELMRVPVYVDSPLAISATEVFEDNMDLFDDETKEYMQKGNNPLEFPGLQFTRTVEESKALNESNESCIIISASGMCDVGRIKHHLKHNIWNPNNTILFVGYQAPGTLGYSIVNGAKKIKLFGEEVAVNARIEYIEGYSGHADQEGLLNFIYSFLRKPKHIFLLHGEPEGQEVLKNKIIETTNLPVSIPSFGETYELTDTDVRLVGRHRRPEKEDNKFTKLAIIDRLNLLKEKIDDMEDIVNYGLSDSNIENGQIDNLNEKIRELQNQINRIVNK